MPSITLQPLVSIQGTAQSPARAAAVPVVPVLRSANNPSNPPKLSTNTKNLSTKPKTVDLRRGTGIKGDGLNNPQGKPINSGAGSVPGSVSLNAEGQRFVDDGGIPWVVTAPLNNSMQSIVGSNRRIEQIAADVTVFGTLPPNFNNWQEFKDWIKQNSSVAIIVGTTPQAYYSFEQLLDTRRIQRGLDILLRPDPTLFSNLRFQLINPNQVFPTPPILPYTVQLNVTTYWNLPFFIQRNQSQYSKSYSKQCSQCDL